MWGTLNRALGVDAVSKQKLAGRILALLDSSLLIFRRRLVNLDVHFYMHHGVEVAVSDHLFALANRVGRVFTLEQTHVALVDPLVPLQVHAHVPDEGPCALELLLQLLVFRIVPAFLDHYRLALNVRLQKLMQFLQSKRGLIWFLFPILILNCRHQEGLLIEFCFYGLGEVCEVARIEFSLHL